MFPTPGRFVVALILATAFAAGCGGDDGDSATFATKLTLRERIGRETAVFLHRTPVHFELSVENRSATEQTLTFSSAQMFEFQVFARGAAEPLWNRSHRRVYSQVEHPVTLAPGETTTFRGQWGQNANADPGTFEEDEVPVGPYEARAFLVLRPGSAPTADAVLSEVLVREFEVSPPVATQHDLAAGLQVFRFSRSGGLGYCPEPESLRHLSVERDPVSGRLHLTGSRFGSFTEEEFFFSCGLADGTCPPVVPLAARTLKAAEEEELLAAFREVAITDLSGWYCGFYDRCLVRSFAWTNLTPDGSTESVAFGEDHCAPRLPDDEIARLVGVVEQLAR